jgi:hypothetical protein
MAIRAAKDVAFFLVDGLSLLGYTSDLSDSKEGVFEDTKPLGQVWPKPTPTGDKMAEFAQQGWFETATDATHAALNEQQGVSRVLAYGYSGNTAGQPFSGYAGIYGSKYKRLASRNQLHKGNADYQISGIAEDGVIVHALGAETADGDTEGSSVDRNDETTVPVTAITSSSVANPSVITCPVPHNMTSGDKAVIDGHTGATPDINGEHEVTVIDEFTFSIPENVTVGGTGGTVKQVSTQNGGSAQIQLTSLTLGGHTNFAPRVLHSDDDATFVELVAFTALTAKGAERKTFSGDAYRYLACDWDFTGAGSSPSATFMIGVTRG